MRSSGLGLVRLWTYPILLAGVALGFDAAERAVPFSILGTGLIDEVCHLATGALGLLVLACFIDVPRRFYVAGLIASVAIDLDHIPVYLGLLGNQFQRPVTHSLATVLVFAGAAVVSRRHRAVLAGAATGLVIHFARDIAEGPPGVRLLWPVQEHGMDCQLLVVPGDDHRVHGRRAGTGECRYPSQACPSVPNAIPNSHNSPRPDRPPDFRRSLSGSRTGGTRS